MAFCKMELPDGAVLFLGGLLSDTEQSEVEKCFSGNARIITSLVSAKCALAVSPVEGLLPWWYQA